MVLDALPACIAGVSGRFMGRCERESEPLSDGTWPRRSYGPLDLSDLLKGYAAGLYLRGGTGCTDWWAAAERMVLFTDLFRPSERFAAKARLGRYRFSLDEAFDGVVEACAATRPRQGDRSWLTDEVAKLFSAAHRAGLAHSVEVWDGDGALAGGAFGLALGNMFFTEAQFQERPDAGHLGFAVLNQQLASRKFIANAAKQATGALCQQGFRPVPRVAFERLLEKAAAGPRVLGRWTLDDADGGTGACRRSAFLGAA